MSTTRTALVSISLTLLAGAAMAAPPQYTIVDLGLLGTNTAAQGTRVSPNGQFAVGRSVGSPTSAFRWSDSTGIVGLPNIAGRNFSIANGVNDNGVVVGSSTTTSFGSGRLPVMWTNGVLSQLSLPAGQTLGDANDINIGGAVVGSVGSGVGQRGTMYDSEGGRVITATTSGGAYSTTLFSINNNGLAVGTGIDPNNAARNVGFVYDSVNNIAFEVPALPGLNGALCFDVSESGFVVGSSMLNQGSGLPFIWSQATGTVAIPLQAGTTAAIARGVNSAGWVVGNGGGATSVPWLFDGTNTYRLNDLLIPGSGWDLFSGTSNSALSISENGTIVGTGLHNGAVHAYAMVLVPTPGAAGLVVAGVLASARRRR